MNNQQIMFSDLIKGKDNNFDLLRFITASAVIFSHAFPLTGLEDPLSILSKGQVSIGNLAVIIFFVISGYFITQSYYYSQSSLKFIKARFLRIFPALIAAVAISTFVIGPIFTNLSLKEYFSNSQTYLYLEAILLYPMQWTLPGVFENNIYPNSVNGSLWSIPFEFMFYIFVLILGIATLLNRKVATVLFSILIMFFVLDYWPFTKTHFWGLEISQIIELLTYFVAGMLFFFIKDKIPYSNFFAMLSIIILFMSIYTGGLKELFIFFGTYLIFFIGYNPKLETWKIYKYGDFSYGMYVYAFPIQQAVVVIFNYNISPYMNFFVSFIITLVLSIFSWYFIEKQALALKDMKIIKFKNFEFIESFKNKVGNICKTITAFIVNRAWVIFLCVFIIFVIVFNKFNSFPSQVTFPYANSMIFSGGWLDQSPNEEYRWISENANISLEKAKGKDTLNIQGYVPENFEEVKNVKVLVDGTEVYGGIIENGEININANLSHIPETKVIDIQIVFNDFHKPDEDSTDQRNMSALISKIQIH